MRDRASQEHMRRMLGEQHGVVHLDRVAGQLRPSQMPDALALRELAADPAAPLSGALLYTKDNGAGKTQACLRFKTGAVQIIATEP